MKKIALLLVVLVPLAASLACTKVLVHGRDKDLDPVTQEFSTSPERAYTIGKEALIRLGYKIENENEKSGTLVTNWNSTKPTSHYVDLFDSKDYGTVGAYYRLKMQITEGVAGRTLVAVSAPVRSIITGRLRSSNREEKKVLKKMRDLLRTDDFSITNVGVEDR